jgi:hypothetical protein
MWREIRSSIFALMVLLAGVSLVSSETFGVRLPAITKLSQSHLYNFSKLPDQKDGLTRALLASAAAAQGPTISDALSSAQVGDANAGEALFIGRIRLANGGLPCISCHSVSGLAFPNGGTMGPDLTGVYNRFRPGRNGRGSRYLVLCNHAAALRQSSINIHRTAELGGIL